jgi:hypothetical protein
VPDAPPKKRFIEIPEDFGEMTDEQKKAWSRSVAAHIAACVAADDAAST